MKRITVPEEGIETLFGSYDENLKRLESLFNVKIRTQGNDLLIDGESASVDKVDRVVSQLAVADSRRLQALQRRREDGRRSRGAGHARSICAITS